MVYDKVRPLLHKSLSCLLGWCFMQGLRCHFISVSGKSPTKLEVTSRHDLSCLLGRKASNKTNKFATSKHEYLYQSCSYKHIKLRQRWYLGNLSHLQPTELQNHHITLCQKLVNRLMERCPLLISFCISPSYILEILENDSYFLHFLIFM